jgi:hypothetical protein
MLYTLYCTSLGLCIYETRDPLTSTRAVAIRGKQEAVVSCVSSSLEPVDFSAVGSRNRSSEGHVCKILRSLLYLRYLYPLYLRLSTTHHPLIDCYACCTLASSSTTLITIPLSLLSLITDYCGSSRDDRRRTR